MTLPEWVVIGILGIVSTIIWWGILRFIHINDDTAKHLTNIDKNLALICERLGKSDMWMEMHSKQDDDRHEEIKNIFGELWSAVDRIRKV